MQLKIMNTAPIKDYLESEHAPGTAVQDDSKRLDYCRAVGGTVYHPTSTCHMGVVPASVVEERILKFYMMDIQHTSCSMIDKTS